MIHTDKFDKGLIYLPCNKEADWEFWLPYLSIPEGYAILGKLEDITEEQANGLVDKCDCGHCDNYKDYRGDPFPFNNAIASLHTRIEAQNIPLQPNETLLIIVKK